MNEWMNGWCIDTIKIWRLFTVRHHHHIMKVRKDQYVSGGVLIVGVLYLLSSGIPGQYNAPLIVAMTGLVLWVVAVHFSSTGTITQDIVDSLNLGSLMLAPALMFALIRFISPATPPESSKVPAYPFIIMNPVTTLSIFLLGSYLLWMLFSIIQDGIVPPPDVPETQADHSIVQADSDACPGRTINDLISDPNWVSYINSDTLSEKRRYITKFAKRYHPVNCPGCQNVCTTTFNHAMAYMHPN